VPFSLVDENFAVGGGNDWSRSFRIHNLIQMLECRIIKRTWKNEQYFALLW